MCISRTKIFHREHVFLPHITPIFVIDIRIFLFPFPVFTLFVLFLPFLFLFPSHLFFCSLFLLSPPLIHATYYLSHTHNLLSLSLWSHTHTYTTQTSSLIQLTLFLCTKTFFLTSSSLSHTHKLSFFHNFLSFSHKSLYPRHNSHYISLTTLYLSVSLSLTISFITHHLFYFGVFLSPFPFSLFHSSLLSPLFTLSFSFSFSLCLSLSVFIVATSSLPHPPSHFSFLL